jgi:2,3-bisphosphoglycerate-dependent phosphoglycerate mutase
MADSTTTLYLVRHGETLWNLEHRFQGQKDSPLSPHGEEQVKCLAPFFMDHPIDALYSSDLGRAMATSKVIEKATGKESQALSAWRERCFGIFEGLTHGPAREKDPESFDLWRSGSMDVKVSEGESRREMLTRVLSSVSELLSRHPGEKIAIVSHGGTLSALWRYLEPDRHESEGFSIPNASISTLLGNDGELKVQEWSTITHLQGLKSLDDPSI